MNRELDRDTFECDLCGLNTPEAGGHDTDVGRLCFSCMFWFEKYGDDGWFTQDEPEDFYV